MRTNQTALLITLFVTSLLVRAENKEKRHRHHTDLSLWIDKRQVRMFSGLSMEIYAIADGNVLPYILDPNFEQYLPVIPTEVGYVNFTWRSGDRRRYIYHFDRLQSFNETILHPPVISIKTRGRVPRKARVFSVYLPCTGNASGIASFGIGLLIDSRRGKPLPGTPLRLRLRKECAEHGPDPECDRKCSNGGWCNHEGMCQCPDGYMGQYCNTALCYPQCMNGGTCIKPGVCRCPAGYQGRHCEGGICQNKCQNGGKCIQKDTCECTKGYYGLRCELSKCIIPCLNGGRCKGVNKCRCGPGFGGLHCEVESGRAGEARSRVRSGCRRSCHRGQCSRNVCHCSDGWYGRHCNKRRPAVRHLDRSQNLPV